MRVKRIETRNFAGLGKVVIDDLDGHSELFVSGKNGVGKSQLLLCIALAAQSIPSVDEAVKYIGPESTTSLILVDFVLDPTEINQFNESVGDTDLMLRGPILRSELVMFSNRDSVQHWSDPTHGTDLTVKITDSYFRSELPFIEVTYLPSDRAIDRNPDLNFSLSSLARGTSLEQSRQALLQQISNYGGVYSYDVFSSLAAMHYAGLLSREDQNSNPLQLDDFNSIVHAFERATGKRINEPKIRPDGSIGMEVLIPPSQIHDVSTLSSGELLSLQLLHFVKQHYQRGSILLIDEPEAHLHPSLQLEIANAIREGVGDGQLWAVTHSPNLLNAVPSNDVIVLNRDPSTGETNATFADSEEKKISLLEELGVAPGLWVPGNFIVIVEGPSDEGYLRRLLPEHFAKAYFVVAGNKSSVKSIADRMGPDSPLPFIAIIDRDRCPVEELDEWNSHVGRFMWNGSAIETLFLDENWLAATLHENDPKWTKRAVKCKLDAAFDIQKEAMRKLWLREEVTRRVPSNENHKGTLEQTASIAVEVANKRLRFVRDELQDLKTEFDTLWKTDVRSFIDPKRALRQLDIPVFKSTTVLTTAMLSKLGRDPSVMPEDLKKLKQKILEFSRV